MVNKIINLITKYKVVLFILISLTPFLWHETKLLNFRYIGTGDFLSPININYDIFSSFFAIDLRVYDAMTNFPSFSEIPILLYYYLFNLLHIPITVSTIGLISLVLFISQLSFFDSAKYFVKKSEVYSLKYQVFLMIISIIYGFSPYVLTLISPGHLSLLIIYALLPLIIKEYDSIINKKVNTKSLLKLYFLLLISSPSFGNIALIYALLIFIFSYSCIYFIKKRITTVVFSFLIFIILLIFSNIWVIFYLLDILTSQLITQLNSSDFVSYSLSYLTQASIYSTIINLFSGAITYIPFIKNNLFLFLFESINLFLVFITLIAIFIKRNRFFKILFIGLIILSLFISKGDQPPFKNIFIWAYLHIPGFQLFRNAKNKFYFYYIFSFLTLLSISIPEIYNKTKNKYGKIIIVFLPLIGCIFTIYIFFNTPLLKLFNIPNSYYKAKEYLIVNKASKILTLPDTNGLTPFYNESINNYHGTDFIPFLWNLPIVFPDISYNSPSGPSKKIYNNIYKNIINSEKICNLLKKAGLSHIMVRLDLYNNYGIEPQFLVKKLNKYGFKQDKFTFGNKDGFYLYDVRSKCPTKIINTDPSTLNQFEYINPSKIELEINNLKNITQIEYLLNYDKNWTIYINQYKDRVIYNNTFVLEKLNYTSLSDYVYLYRKPLSKNIIKNDFANGWNISKDYILENYPSTYYHLNSDNSINVQLTILYKNQLLYFATTIIWIIINLLLLTKLILLFL
jgi:hypothetical protein